MDEYTKMLTLLPEIQEAWEPRVGDHVYLPNMEREFFLDIGDITEASQKDSTLIWLPRIEDLMAMLSPKDISILVPYTTISTSYDFNRILALGRWIDSSHTGPYKFNITGFIGTKLWLCFVISILYSKIWDGEAWVAA